MVTFSDAALAGWLASFLLPFLRVLALFSAAPLLSSRSVPMRARVALAAAIALAIMPTVAVPADLSLASLAALAAVAQQVIVGLVLGLAARLMFALFEIAGEAIGLQMGLSFAGYFSLQGGSQNAVGAWLAAVSTLFLLALDVHLLLIDALAATFRVIPIATGLTPAAALPRLDLLAAEMFRLALALALPAFMVLLFVNIAMGLASRVAPQLSIFAIGFPLSLLTGMAVLLFGTHHVWQIAQEALRIFLGG